MTIKQLSFALLFWISTTLFAATTDTPDLGSPEQAFINPSQERLMGKQFMHAVRYQVPVLQDTIVSEYLERLGHRLTQTTHYPHYHFFAVNDSSINAFAGPGGYIGVNAGLVTTTEDEAELAAVLAHEIMHVEQRHIARRITHSEQRHWPSIGAIIGAILIGSQIDSTVATGAILGATASQMQQGISMTRQFELEADRLGIELLDNSGFDVHAMPEFFARMQQRTLDYGNPRFKLLRTHPVTQERIADSTNRAKHYQRKARQIHEDYPLIRARMRVLSSKSPEQSLSYYEKMLQHTPTPEAHYGYALSLALMHQPKLAIERLRVLAEQHKKSIVLAATISDIMASYDPRQAVESYKKLHQKLGFHQAIVINLAHLLVQTKAYREAIALLQQYNERLNTNPEYHWIISQAYGHSQSLYEAYRHRMDLHDLLGQPAMAIKQGLIAKKHAKSYEKKHIIDEKIRQLTYDLALLGEE